MDKRKLHAVETTNDWIEYTEPPLTIKHHSRSKYPIRNSLVIGAFAGLFGAAGYGAGYLIVQEHQSQAEHAGRCIDAVVEATSEVGGTDATFALLSLQDQLECRAVTQGGSESSADVLPDVNSLREIKSYEMTLAHYDPSLKALAVACGMAAGAMAGTGVVLGGFRSK